LHDKCFTCIAMYHNQFNFVCKMSNGKIKLFQNVHLGRLPHAVTLRVPTITVVNVNYKSNSNFYQRRSTYRIGIFICVSDSNYTRRQSSYKFRVTRIIYRLFARYYQLYKKCQICVSDSTHGISYRFRGTHIRYRKNVDYTYLVYRVTRHVSDIIINIVHSWAFRYFLDIVLPCCLNKH